MSKKFGPEGVRVILTHEHTDFDGLASLLAAAKLYHGAIPVLPQQPNRNLRAFLSIYWDELPFVRREDMGRRRIEEAIVVDTQSVAPIKGMNERTRIHIIDHHPLASELKEGTTFRGEELGATTTLLVEEIRERRIVLSPIEATLLLLGIYEDTGALTYTTTTPRDAYAAAWLLEQGADLAVADRYLHRPLSEEQMRIYAQLVREGEMRRVHGYAIFVAAIALGEEVEELSTLAHKVGDLLDPDASFMFFAHDEGIQFIARSVTEAINVAEIARHFGGGGHSKAAAAVISDLTLPEAKAKLEKLLQDHVRPPVTVRDIMSFGVRTLRPDIPLREAERIARRYGHEGFPVLDNGRLVGVLTRREIEKAIYHQLGGAQVGMYMRKGDIHVSPDDPVERVQEVMTQYDVGQIPVVEEGEVIGIVTRTDLIKLWATPANHSRRQEIVARMEEILPAPRRDLILKVRDVANALGYSLYAVGGFVRDLLLGVPDLDLDLVVEGDAIEVAYKLAEDLGRHVRVRSHRRFGTAKLILEGTCGTTLPRFLDLATARVEFYESNRPTLPRVEGSSIKEDLKRRDFTINTLAICLDQGRYGELLDYFGGVKDLQDGLIRVLHNFSFVEDPTRILRAVRLEQRLGFAIEAQTAGLIAQDLDRLEHVTGERIRNELSLIFREEKPEQSWRRLAELGVLKTIHPALRDDAWLQDNLSQLRPYWRDWQALHSQSEVEQADTAVAPPATLYWGLITFAMTEEELQSFIARLRIPRREARCLWETAQLRDARSALAAPDLAFSEIYRLLEPYSDEALFLVWLASDEATVRQHIELYQRRLRWAKPRLDGAYLKALGLKPGPIYRRILTELHDAVLNGLVPTRADQEAFVQRLLEETPGSGIRKTAA